MNKELLQKVVEAGIVPAQAVKQLKAWKQLPDDMQEEEIQQITQQQLMEFVQDLAELLDEGGELPELRETMLDIDARFNNDSQACVVLIDIPVQRVSIGTRVLADVPFFVFKADKYGEVVARIGNQISLGESKVYEVFETTPLYQGENVAFYRCRVQEVPRHAQMPELRQLST